MVQGAASLKRVAFTLIGGNEWAGGYNYQINLLSALMQYEKNRVQPILFLGVDVDSKILSRFNEINGLTIIQSSVFDKKHSLYRLFQAIICGKDFSAYRLFSSYQIDIVFESANFYGWRFPISSMAWIPDLQHKHLKHLFNFFSYWKREIGFRAQVLSGRHILLSSKDALSDFKRFYRIDDSKAHVVSFAIPAELSVTTTEARQIADQYNLPKYFFFLPNQFWEHKNHQCVVSALDIARSRGKEIVVAVSGKQVDLRNSTYFPQLKNLVYSLGLEHQFKMIGVIPYPHVVALMLSCAALINPSRFEGWSTTVEEAKALGIPMLLSDLDVHHEQAAGLAQYFPPNAPEVLADLFINFSLNVNTARNLMQKQALMSSNSRVAVFAKDFADCVYAIS